MFKVHLDRLKEQNRIKAEQQVIAKRKQREERRKAGVCVACGKPVEVKDSKFCDLCKLKDRYRHAGVDWRAA